MVHSHASCEGKRRGQELPASTTGEKVAGNMDIRLSRFMRPALGMYVILFTARLAFGQSDGMGETTAGATDDAARATDEARALVVEAIRLGVPLYNDGQAAACAAVYNMTLRSLQLLAPPGVDLQSIDRALRTAAEQSPERSAWTLRYALDAVYRATEGVAPMDEPRFRIDFADRSASWYTVNDNVMGGVSRGGFGQTEEGTGRFSGQLSMQNNGGFSSIRTRIATAALAGYDGVEMRVRGDGRLYTLLAAPANSRGSWQGTFTATEAWQTIRVPFEEMRLSVRGWRPSNSPILSGGDIGMLGLLVADKQTRPFRLEIDWIQGFVNEVAANQ